MGKNLPDYTNEEIYSDEELAALAKNGDAHAVSALIARLIPVIKNKVFLYKDCWPGHDDLLQEGMLGILSAVKTFDSSREASFKTYASVCIGNRITSAIRGATGKKRIPENQFVSLEDEELPLTEPHLNPEEVVLDNEAVETIQAAFSKLLSPFEHEVLMLYLNGHSYEEIAVQLDSTAKSVDNALQRVRRKLKFLM